MSDSYNQDRSAPTSAADDVQSGDLPGDGNPFGNTTPVEVLDDSESSGTDEGRAMLQLIHDLAPGADLAFHTAFGGLANFAQGIRELAEVGCTAIVDDVRNNGQPFYQDGPISLAVDEVVETDGVTYFSSAGNSEQNSYEAPFRSSGEPGVLNTGSVAHDFDDASVGVDTRQEIKISVGGEFQVFSLQWTDPSNLTGNSQGPDTDLDLALVDRSDNVVAESSIDNIDGFPTPFESLKYSNTGTVDTDNDGTPDSTFSLVIEKAAGPDPDEVKYIYSGSDYEIKEYDTKGPTIFGHPTAERAMAVGAAPFFNTARFNARVDSAAVLEFFSSKGGIPIRFDSNGNQVPPTTRQKPEVTSTDWLDNTFFGEDLPTNLFDPDSDPNFVGTSAASPNVAAIAALIRQARPELSPAAVYERLTSSAVDVQFRQVLVDGELQTEPTGVGVDPWSGHGFVRADRAIPPPTGVRLGDLSATGSVSSANQGDVTLEWRKVGEGDVDEFVVEHQFFREPFSLRKRVSGNGSQRFTTTIEDLPIGEHTFRLRAVRNDSTLAVGSVRATLRAPGINAMVYPNPFQESVNLTLTFPETKDEDRVIRVTIFDASGRWVATPISSRTVDDAQSIHISGSPLSTLGSGVYFFLIRGQQFTETVRAVRVQ